MTAGAVIDRADILIVGAGHAGAQCAIALRQKGFEGSIALIGRESELPYERPPLSKDYFAREKPFERLHIRPLSFWQDRNIDLVLGREVIAVDAPGHRVVLSDGPEIGYGHLVWAAGGDPRKLACPGADLAGVHGIRTRADCDRLMAGIDAGWRRFVVIGGGYIGLEAAAVLRKAGCEVTLLEAGQRVLARVAGPEISAFYEAEHRAMGVDLRTDVTVSRLRGEQQVTGVELADGKVIPADAVIVGIGIQPCIDPLVAAGVLIDGGVRVDEQCRTSLADIHAIGDCVSFACAFADDAVMRVESVQNANDQASCVASALCGQPIPYRAFPWFWSNQYDLKLQTAGLSVGHDAAITRGDPATRAFSVVYMREGRVIALDCVNMVKDYVQGRKLIEEGARLDPAQVGDVTVSLKDLMLSARMRA